MRFTRLVGMNREYRDSNWATHRTSASAAVVVFAGGATHQTRHGLPRAWNARFIPPFDALKRWDARTLRQTACSAASDSAWSSRAPRSGDFIDDFENDLVFALPESTKLTWNDWPPFSRQFQGCWLTGSE